MNKSSRRETTSSLSPEITRIKWTLSAYSFASSPTRQASCWYPAQAQYSGGTGEPNDPYQIATAEDLMLLGETPEDYDKHFILTADIDLDPNLPGRKVFDKAVIAPETDNTGWFEGDPFTGVFDGNERLFLGHQNQRRTEHVWHS